MEVTGCYELMLMYKHFKSQDRWLSPSGYYRKLTISLKASLTVTLNRHDISRVIFPNSHSPAALSLDSALLSANLNGQANGPLAFSPAASVGCAITVLAFSHSV